LPRTFQIPDDAGLKSTMALLSRTHHSAAAVFLNDRSTPTIPPPTTTRRRSNGPYRDVEAEAVISVQNESWMARSVEAVDVGGGGNSRESPAAQPPDGS
jgi:hypothetical protein